MEIDAAEGEENVKNLIPQSNQSDNIASVVTMYSSDVKSSTILKSTP